MEKHLKKLFFICLGVLSLAISVNTFLAPHNIAAGGLTGLAIILEHVAGFDRSTIVMIFNIFIVIITYLFLGKEVFFNTIIGAALLPFFLRIVPHYTLINDVLLSNIFGSVLFGIGVIILFTNRASSGGTSIPPLILQKYYGINTSVGLLITDSLIVFGSMFVFGVESFFNAIFSIVLTSATMNYIETGIHKKRLVQIISKKKEHILKALLQEVDTGVTVIPATGGHSGAARSILMLAINNRDYSKVKKIVDHFDKEAFIIVHNVADVHGGLGFSYPSHGV